MWSRYASLGKSRAGGTIGLAVVPYRFMLVAVGLFSLLAVLVWRLVDVQLWRGSYFLQQAENNRFYATRLPAERGLIFDRYHSPLVWNKRQYWITSATDSAVLNPTNRPAQLDRVPVTQAVALPWLATQSARVSYTLYREYPYEQSLAPVLGYTGAVTADELWQDSSLSISSLVGKTGLERSWDQRLRGQDGRATYEVDAFGRQQRLVSEQTPRHGQNMVSTLDPYLSVVAHQAMGEFMGAVVISDATSGAVLALVSTPSYDNNIFKPEPVLKLTASEKQKAVAQAFANPKQLFFNRAIAGSYPPGSIFKLITAIAGLDSGVLTSSTTVVDEGVLKVGAFEFRNWLFTKLGRTDGSISVVRALSRSNDIFFYKAAEWITPNILAQMAERFGLGQAPGTELTGEAVGLVPTPEWKEAHLGEPWYLGNTYHFGIGQGDLLVTPLQVNQLVQAFANQGRLCTPYFGSENTPNCREVGVQSAHLELVLSGMLNACSPGGTAASFFSRNTKQRTAVVGEDGQQVFETGSPDNEIKAGAVACKTGTAEFGAQESNGYRKTHGWFVSIVEPSIPELTEHGQAATIVTETALGTPSGTQLNDLSALRQSWAEQLLQHGFPRRLAITVLVESDEQGPYKEGSTEAAGVVKKILDWIENNPTLPASLP